MLGSAADIRGVVSESEQRKAAFLGEAARGSGARLEVVASRLEQAQVPAAPVVTARALAPLGKLLEWAFPLLEAGGRCLFLKGQQAAQEIREAEKDWRMDIRTYPSQTASDGVILEVSNFNRVR